MSNKFYSFSGRFNRKKYWQHSIIFTFLPLTLLIIIGLMPDSLHYPFSLTYSIIFIVSLIVFIIGNLTAMVKRFHDLNYSGWRTLGTLIPIYGFYLIYLLYFQKGTDGKNYYGKDPLSLV